MWLKRLSLSFLVLLVACRLLPSFQSWWTLISIDLDTQNYLYYLPLVMVFYYKNTKVITKEVNTKNGVVVVKKTDDCGEIGRSGNLVEHYKQKWMEHFSSSLGELRAGCMCFKLSMRVTDIVTHSKVLRVFSASVRSCSSACHNLKHVSVNDSQLSNVTFSIGFPIPAVYERRYCQYMKLNGVEIFITV